MIREDQDTSLVYRPTICKLLQKIKLLLKISCLAYIQRTEICCCVYGRKRIDPCLDLMDMIEPDSNVNDERI